MANKDDYLTYYREFFENFAQTINPNDQLPVKLASYKLVNIEVVGGIIDWTTQYLTQKKCPTNLLAPLIKIVIEEVRKDCKKQPLSCGFIPSDNAYEPLKLMQTVMAKTNEVCLRYLDNSQLCSLPSPVSTSLLTSVCAVKNTRRRMEDRHVVIHDLNTMFNIQEASPSSYYAVFDGHAGHDAATYSSAHLHQFLAENKYFISNPEQALLDAFCKTDALFIDKCRVENLSSGTTAVVALLRPKEKTLYIAWVGDSQALLVNQGKILQVVNPHKPSRQDERERIEKEGGCVLLWGTWRVNGQLAVSRAIGDAEYKPYVIAIPDVREIPLDGGEDFLILACDGLWDFVSEDCAARAVYRLVMENSGTSKGTIDEEYSQGTYPFLPDAADVSEEEDLSDDIDRISQHLAQLSKDQGSTDNISVIVVFLREPSKIAAEAHWANRNCTQVTMDASLDNANNPFAISNGASTDNIISQKSDGLLLNLTDNFKQNGTDLSPTADFYAKEKSNGKRTASEFEDDDFGPETDVDAVDDALSPAETAKVFGDIFSNNNPAEGVYNPFMEHQEKAALEHERELQKQESEEFDVQRLAREETPTPPADAVQDVSGLVDNTADSESEDEWNYFKGEEANKENISPQPDREVAEVPEEDDNMSQLNPNAAEFVPVSPTRSIPSPACRTLLNDQVISQSPRRPANDIDINVPNPVEFEKEVKSRPSEVDSYSNGHSDSDHNITPTDLMENILNGKNIDEIPEFQPGSTPRKNASSEEFHFGPNAAPFTPAKFLDQSEAALSTKAVFGDESTATLGTSFNESVGSQDTTADINLLNKESDPMSMSFYADKGDTNPFDLNEVHILPENIDEFLKKPDNSMFNDTISDLPEHYPLEDNEKTNDLVLNNDYAIQTIDFDKRSYDDEKELASPLEPEKELSEAEKVLLGGGEECDISNTPEPSHENLLGQEFCQIHEKPRTPDNDSLPRDVELISPEPTNKQSESTSPASGFYKEESSESRSPLLEATEVDDLLQAQPESLPQDVELIPTQLTSASSSLSHEEVAKSPHPEASSDIDLLVEKSEDIQLKSPLPELSEISDLPKMPTQLETTESQTENNDLLQTESDSSNVSSPLPEAHQAIHSLKPESDISESTSPLPVVTDDLGPKSPLLADLAPEVCELPKPRSPTSNLFQAKSPDSGRSDLESPVCNRPETKSPDCQLEDFDAPVCELPVLRSPVCEFGRVKSPICDIIVESILPDQSEAKSPVLEHTKEVCDLSQDVASSLPAQDLVFPLEEGTPDFTKPDDIEQSEMYFADISKFTENVIKPEEDTIKEALIEQAQAHFEEICQPKENVALLESPQDNITSSFKNELCSLPQTRPPRQTTEDEFVVEQPSLVTDIVQDIAEIVSEPIVATAPLAATSESTPPISPAQPNADTESVATTDVNSFLDRSLPPDVASPLSPTEQETEDMKKCVYQISDQFGERSNEQTIHHMLDYSLSSSVKPLEAGEQIEIKTDNITPEYAEQTLVTPSEESKQEDVPITPTEEPVSEPAEKKESGPAEMIAVGAAAVAVAAASTKLEKDEKKKPGASPVKKLPATKSTTTKTSTKTSVAPKEASRLSASPKTAPAKIGTAKPMTASAPKPPSAKASSRPRPASTLKSTEKKPLANGDIKSLVRSTLTSKKPTESSLAKSSTPRPATTAKLSPTKTATSRSVAPRLTTTTARTTTTRLTATTTSTASKPRPTTLANKTSVGTTTKTSTAMKSPTKTPPKVASAPPRPKPPTTTLSRPRVPLTKTISKAPDTEKQIKESANKLTASRTVTGTTRTVSAPTRTTSSTTRKIESKMTTTGTRTMKTTTTTTKSTTARKPAEIVRNINSSKTKTTKIEKPKENGVSTVVTEEITVVNNTSSVIDSEPQLIKDNSPVDNKLAIENTLIQPNIAD